jgi:hypothetical protein
MNQRVWKQVKKIRAGVRKIRREYKDGESNLRTAELLRYRGRRTERIRYI